MSTIDFRLPENMTIANIGGLHEEFEAIVGQKDCDRIVLQADSVTRADTAGIQLLLALINASRERQIDVDWSNPSEKLCSAAGILGLDTALGIH